MDTGTTLTLLFLIAVTFAMPYRIVHSSGHWLASHFPTLFTVVAQLPAVEASAPPANAALHAGLMGTLAFQKLCNFGYHVVNLLLWTGKDGASVQAAVELACKGDAPHFDRTRAPPHDSNSLAVAPADVRSGLSLSLSARSQRYVRSRQGHLASSGRDADRLHGLSRRE
jgi:hypothetical protein